MLDLPLIGRLEDELLATVLVLEVLFLIGVMTVLRREVDEPADERVPLRLATSTDRLTGREKDRLVIERVLVAGVDDFLCAGLVMLGLVARRAAGADLVDFGREAGRGAETLRAGLDALLGADLAARLGAGLLTGLDRALGTDRDARGGADLAREAGRDFDAAFGAALLAGDDLAERPDDLPLCCAAVPGTGPRVTITVRSTANTVFCTCLVNISLSFPGQVFWVLQRTASDPSGQIGLFCFP